MMKILYMSHRYHINQSTIMKGWIESGHEVRFLSQYVGKIEDHTYVKPIVVGYCIPFKIFNYIYIHYLKRNEYFAFDMKLKWGVPPIFKLAKYIKEFHPDIAILRERSVYTICMNAICRFYRIPTILYNMNPVWDKPKVMDLPHKIVWKLTPKYRITPTDYVGVDKSGLVKDDNAYWAPYLMEPKISPEEKPHFYKDRINIFCIGKYQERKNHQMMIEAVEELLPKYNLHLTIAGEITEDFYKDYFNKIKKYVKEHKLDDKVTLLVNLNRNEIYEEYKKADVYVIPSTGEPASVTVPEAMSCSVATISGSDNGTASYIDPGLTGYIFEDNNKEDLKDKLEKIISSKENVVEMGTAGYYRVKSNFQFKNYYEQIQKIMERQQADKRKKRK